MGRRWRWAAAIVAVMSGVVAVRVLRSDDPPPSYQPGDLLVPGEFDGHEIVDLERTGVAVASSRQGIPQSLLVTRFSDAVVAIGATPVAEMSDFQRSFLDDDRDRSTVGDAPAVRYGSRVFPWTPAEEERTWLSWMETDDVVVSIASRDLDRDDLESFAEQVDLDDRGEIVAPGEVIGEIPSTWALPEPGILAVYTGWDSPTSVVVHSASPDVQAAYLALAPDGAINERTQASCCTGHTGEARSEVRVGDRSATIATLDLMTRILVIEGDPGAVMLVGPEPSNDDLVALATTLTPVAPEDFDPFGPQ